MRDPTCEVHSFPLFHGTIPENAYRLLRDGWKPGIGPSGANMGQNRYLYLTTEVDDAAWFAEQKGSTTILAVRNVPAAFLLADPEDGTGNTPDEEIDIARRTGLPAKLVLIRPLGAQHFSLLRA